MKQDVPAIDRYLNQPAPGWLAVSRGSALGLSLLMGLNLAEAVVYSTSAVNNWFTHLSPLTQPIGVTILAMAATSWLMFAVRPALPGPVQFAALALIVTLSGFCGRDLWLVSQHADDSQKAMSMTQPLGTLMLLAVAGVGIVSGNSSSARGRSSFIAILVSAFVAILCFAVISIQTGGVSDAIPAEATPVILVLGCGDSPNGKPSDKLTDRLNTAFKLIQDRKAKTVILSGSTEVSMMNELALAAGLGPDQILLDDQQTNIASSVQFAASQEALKSDRRLIVVSHWHELSRIRLLVQRSGLQAIGVAAQQEHALFNQNFLVLKEAAMLISAQCEPAVRFIRNPPQAQATLPSEDDVELDFGDDRPLGSG